MAWSRLAMARSGSGSSAIFASKSLSPSALRAAIFCSWTRSIIAAFSSSVNPSYLFLVAVVLADLCVSFTAVFFSVISGCRLIGDLPLLEDPDGVAEGVADAHVGAVEVVGGFLGEVGDAARLEGLVQTPDVVRLEHEPAQRALRDQLAELRSGGFVMHRRTRLLERDLGDVAGDAHRQPAVGTLLDVLALLEPELVDVEVKGLVLVEDHDGGDVEFGDHRSFSPWRDLMGMTLML